MSSALRIGILTPVLAADVHLASDYANISIRCQVFEPPLRPRADGKGIESAVLEWPLREEPPEAGRWVFSAEVVPERFFTDGTPVTAERVRAALSLSSTLRKEADVSTRGGRVFFTLKRKNPRFDRLLCDSGVAIVATGPLGPLGTGPYTIEPGRLLRNPHYRPLPPIEEVLLDVYPPTADGQPTALLDAINAGQVDFAYQVPYAALTSLKNVRKLSSLGVSTCSLFFNTERPVLANPRVRRALAQCIDRRALAAACYANPMAFEGRGLLPPTLGREDDQIAYNLAEARQTLSEVGVSAPAQPLKLVVIPLVRPYLPDPAGVARRVADGLGAAGWPVEPHLPGNLGEYAKLVGSGAYDLALQGWQPEQHDPLKFLEVHLSSTQVPARPDDIYHCVNLSRYRSASMDACLAKHRAEGDDASWREIHQLLRTEVPLLPLQYGPSVVVMSWRVVARPESFLYRPFLAEMSLG